MLLGLCLIVASAVGGAQAALPPNFAFMLGDDWGFGDVGAYNSLLSMGVDRAATPNLDRLARAGTLFTDFHTLGAECSPSRASWLTGRSPSDARVRINLVLASRAQNKVRGNVDFLNTSTPTVTSVLKQSPHGYRTGHFGKWHLGMLPAGDGEPAAPPLSEYDIDSSRCYVCNNPQAQQYDVSGLWWSANSSRLIVDDALSFINSSVAAAAPFYLNVWLHNSHAALRPTLQQLQALADHWNATDPVTLCPGPNPKPHLGGYPECPILDFRATQFEADAQLGRLIDTLDAMRDPRDPTGATSVGDNTVFVFSGDNGPEDPNIYPRAVGDPGPFRGRKRSLYEGGVRMPLIVRYSAAQPSSGSVSGGSIMSADWLPTVAALADAPLPEGLMGRDASGFFDASRPAPAQRSTPVMFDYRADGYGHCWNQAPRLAIRDGDLKLLMNVDRSRVELFNLSASTFEADNLAAAMPEEVDRLAARLQQWQATVPQSPLMQATHMGCLNYAYPQGSGAGVGAWGRDGAGGVASFAAQLNDFD